ncbi:MAG TPA: hypothetical protein VIL84_13750 [Devosiaceae bacterium]
MRHLVILTLALALVAPLTALGDEPPLPRPRPHFSGDTVNPDEVPADVPVPKGENPVLAASEPQPVTLSARVSEDGPIITSGLVWRVYNTKADARGQLELIGKSNEAAAGFALPVGQYVVHVAYGRAQASDTMDVETGPNAKTIILDAGALQLNGKITGDLSIPANLLSFDIFTSTESASERVPVAEKVAPDEIVRVNAGVYQIVSHYGSANASVRADLRVEPGKLTEATLYHKASQVTLRLVSKEGGEAIADVDWTVKTSAGDTVFTHHGAFPSVVLEAGDYLVLAKLGDRVYNREFQIQPGKPHLVEVLTTVY